MTAGPVAPIDTDVAIAGSGFAGAMTALALRRQGRSVVLLERGRHPRFAIGESSTPLANLLIEELADRGGLPRLRPFSKWGTWQATYPEVACGLKRGFSFYQHAFGAPFVDSAAHARQLLVAASPHDGIADTHWYRPDFDHWLVGEAEREGVVYLDELGVETVRVDAGSALLEGMRAGHRMAIRARFLIDASGPRGVLVRALGLGDVAPRWLPPTQGLYAHFRGVEPWASVVDCGDEPPYPVDAAALHHVFPGGWIWVLRFNHGITSAGVAASEALARDLGLGEGEAAWHRLLARLPSVAAQFARARPVTPFVHTPRVAFRTGAVIGPAWALLPSAAGVIDPLLSTGFPLTLLGMLRLTDILGRLWDRPAERLAALEQYERETQAELDATERLVAALYATMHDFTVFKRLTLLYFAAASYAEAVRRLGRPERARGFLLHADPAFGPTLERATVLAHDPSQRDRLLAHIDHGIEPYDTAGLLDRARRDWYPVRASDLLAGAAKLGASEREVRALLARGGFGPA